MQHTMTSYYRRIDATQIFSPCGHEEADTRLIVHVIDALKYEHRSIEICTVDTDVVVIVIGLFHKLHRMYEDMDIWIKFGVGKNLTHFSINALCISLQERKSSAMPIFHAFTGCDTTSAFSGKGKKSCWKAWDMYPEVTDAFLDIVAHPFIHMSSGHPMFAIIERLVVILYDSKSSSGSVNETRSTLFQQLVPSLERLPPTRDALIEHFKRSILQASIWVTSDNPDMPHFSPGYP